MSTEVETVAAAFKAGVEDVPPSPRGKADMTEMYLRTFHRLLASLRLEAGMTVDDEKLIALADARAAQLVRDF